MKGIASSSSWPAAGEVETRAGGPRVRHIHSPNRALRLVKRLWHDIALVYIMSAAARREGRLCAKRYIQKEIRLNFDKIELDQTQASILDVQARLLYSFSPPEASHSAGYLETLLRLKHNGRPVWRKAEPKEIYLQEMLASADMFLFPEGDA